MRPFFCYAGGKWRIANKYSPPVYGKIIEPFAGAAGYSVRHYQKNIVLYDIDPTICRIWDYLIKSKSEEILKLPLKVHDVRELNICQEAKWLIGFWLNKGTSSPCNKPSTWVKSGIRPNSSWGKVIRERIANQVKYIKHWKIINSSYENIVNEECTWFIDPPYFKKKCYKYKEIDYELLSNWCKSRDGQVIVCEGKYANWLPFKALTFFKGQRKKSVEFVWTKSDKILRIKP